MARIRLSQGKGREQKGVDKSTLALSEPHRVRDRDHVRYATKAC
jgi:hypothetical protein